VFWSFALTVCPTLIRLLALQGAWAAAGQVDFGLKKARDKTEAFDPGNFGAEAFDFDAGAVSSKSAAISKHTCGEKNDDGNMVNFLVL
jgi:hypothetical protein